MRRTISLTTTTAVLCIAACLAIGIRAAAQDAPAKEEKAGAVEQLFTKGLTPHAGIAAVCQFTAKDGNNGPKGGACTFDTTLMLDLDFEKAGFKTGGQLFIDFEILQGTGITERRLGDLFGVNNYEARHFTQLSEFWYRKAHPSGSYFKLGLMDSSTEFQSLDGSGDFLNSSFGLIPNVPAPTYPDYAFGVVANKAISNKAYVRFGAIDSSPLENTSRIGAAFDKTFYAVEAGISPFANSTYRLGVFHRTGEISESFDGEVHKGNHGFYIAADHALTPNVAFFVQYSGAPGEVNLFSRYYGAGLVFANEFKTRPNDSFGVAYCNGLLNTYTRVAGAGRGESVIELYYKMQFDETFSIMPDLQWVKTPGGTGRNNFVYGMKGEYAF